MQITNRSTHPSAEVERLVRQAYGTGRAPARLIVHERSDPNDDREGFTPFDRNEPTDLWIEPANRYPQPGNARTWQQELFESAAHEAYHFRNPDRACPKGSCDRRAEHYARQRYASAGAFRRKRANQRPAWCGRAR